MVKNKSKFKCLFLLSMSLLLVLSTSLIMSSTKSIYDEASIFTSDEISQLSQQAKIISDKYNMDVVIVSTDDTAGKSSQIYADDFYDKNNIGRNASKDGVLLLIDLDNREIYISTAGEAITYFSDQRLDSVISQVLEGGMADGNYYQAGLTFINSTKDYLNKGTVTNKPSGPKIKGLKALTPVDGIISLGLGSLASVLFYFKNKSKYKMESPNKFDNFRKNSQVIFNNKQDRFIKTKTIEKTIESSESSKTTTHTSTSGKKHGGGGAKF